MPKRYADERTRGESVPIRPEKEATMAEEQSHGPPQRDEIAKGARSAWKATQFGIGRIRAGMEDAAEAVQEGIRNFSFKWLFLFLVVLGLLPIVVVMYLIVSAEGLRSIAEILGTPLRKFVPMLNQWQETRKI